VIAKDRKKKIDTSEIAILNRSEMCQRTQCKISLIVQSTWSFSCKDNATGELTNGISTQVMKMKDQLLPNIGLHVWLMTSKQTEPDLKFASIQKWLETKLLSWFE